MTNTEGSMGRDSSDVLGRVDAVKESYLEELKSYLPIPSISTDPDYKGEVRHAADYLADTLRAAGSRPS